ncbi:RanGTP-binding protein-domain-containing protein [Gilbertella persicaria]|uniref:RanGTP-binding protein-domain-containing protein n=1 Tax=Gilbertella persicaria TaxID=101096 RepID=UPI00221F96D1|nr:RanGTP-binding protein-domain-containing protein [Gilbertella persicaria]KAI8083243.1 RanGTP-binding protein-domain-containing protein [Gilbertella persicaria]
MSSIENLFGKLALTTVTTVSRIALSHATNAAIRNVTSYITTQLPKNKPDSKEIRVLQRQLDLKIKNLKPTIDIIARSVADGNTDLEPALEMCNDLKTEMELFAKQNMTDPDQVKFQLRRLLESVDDAIPSLHLSLRSIENRTGQTNLSPSKLIQASRIVTDPSSYSLKIRLYSLFAANQRAAAAEAFSWKEEFHKAELKINKHKEYTYELALVEDVHDGLYHEEGSDAQKLNIDIGKIKRMYYTQSGELLNIEDAKSPVLVVKVAKQAKENESMVEIKDARPEINKEELQEYDWYAIELWTNGQTIDDDSDEESTDSSDDQDKKTSDPVIDNKQPQNLLLLESVK